MFIVIYIVISFNTTHILTQSLQDVQLHIVTKTWVADEKQELEREVQTPALFSLTCSDTDLIILHKKDVEPEG